MKDIQTEINSAAILLNASLYLSVLQGGGGDHLCSVLAYHLVWSCAVRVQTHPEALRLLSVFSPSDAHLPRCYGENTPLLLFSDQRQKCTPACWTLPWDTHSFIFAVVAATVHTRVFKPPTRPSAPQIVLHREKEVKQTECDMAMVHHLLSRIPQDLPYELLICRARELFDQYPPSLLAKQAALQSHKR